MSLPPGSTIGILGGGQLGRMLALAAAPLGYRCVILAPEPSPPAGDVAFRTIEAAYDDEAQLQAFAEMVDVVTIEFENVPCHSLEFLANHVPVRPSDRILDITQHRVREKSFLRDIGVGVAPFHAVQSEPELNSGVNQIGMPAILKTCRLGYDGKGQASVDTAAETGRIWQTLATDDAILEAKIAFECEISVITARSPSGSIRSFPPVLNHHENHILKKTIAPAPIDDEIISNAVSIAERIAAELKLEGLIAVEMFLLKNGDILVNELAPRPHNSGHWSIDACQTSQFEQTIRAICDLPLGDTTPTASAEMINLLGDEWLDWPKIVSEPANHLHLYGKTSSKPGRKMGHYTKVTNSRH